MDEIKPNVWDERFLLDKLGRVNIIPRVLSLIEGRKVSQSRHVKVKALSGKKIHSQEI